MSSTDQNFKTASSRTDNRALWFVAPLAAMAYPLPLMGFHASIAATNADGNNTAWLAWFAATASLLLAFSAPLAALLSAMRLSAIEMPTKAELRARQVAFL